MFITKSLRVALIALTLVGTAHAEKTFAADTASFTQDQIVAATNKARVAEGLSALTVDPELTKAAQMKADDMVANGYFAHFSPNGVTPWHWFDLAGYGYTEAGENLASGFTTTKGVMKGWMNSPTHKANIMGAQYEEIGVAFAKAEKNGKTVWYVVQMFGAE